MVINPREIKLLQVQEGLRLLRYLDSNGFWTLGYGRNIEARGQMECITCTQEQAQDWLIEDITDVRRQLANRVSYFLSLSEVRQAVLVSMGFMGVSKLMGFVKFFGYLASSQWRLASAEMLNSKWAHEVKMRAATLSNMVFLDAWPRFTES